MVRALSHVLFFSTLVRWGEYRSQTGIQRRLNFVSVRTIKGWSSSKDRDKLQPAIETQHCARADEKSTVLRMEMAQRVHFMIPFWSFENVKSPSTLVPVQNAQSQRVSSFQQVQQVESWGWFVSDLWRILDNPTSHSSKKDWNCKCSANCNWRTH